MKRLLNVSRGQSIRFAANGSPVSGIVVGSESIFGPWASVAVETEAHIPEEAQLTMPELPETGGCGLAEPKIINDRVQVILSIGYNHIDLATLEK
jgi:hypothetical protein